MLLRASDLTKRIGRPSDSRTTRSPSRRSLGVRPLRHSSTHQTNQPTPSVTVKSNGVSARASMRLPKPAAGTRPSHRRQPNPATRSPKQGLLASPPVPDERHGREARLLGRRDSKTCDSGSSGQKGAPV